MNDLKIDWNAIDHDEFTFWYERYAIPKTKAKDSKTLGKGFKKAKRNNDFDGNF